VDDPLAEQEKSVQRTVAWARRCKAEFGRLVGQRLVGQRLVGQRPLGQRPLGQRPLGQRPSQQRPYLIAVVQGGASQSLRRQCAEQLLEIGFDGYGFGGWPLDGEGHLLIDMVAYVRELIPRQFTLHGLGIGHPANVVACVQLGYELFDSTMPTRDARHGRVYSFTMDPTSGQLAAGGDFFRYIYLKDDKHIKTSLPISPFCDCPTCERYSLGYLHHLFKLNDNLYPRLATIHNLRFMTQLMETLGGMRRKGHDDESAVNENND
jgi:queuine tRNA-ribosyltransferase